MKSNQSEESDNQSGERSKAELLVQLGIRQKKIVAKKQTGRGTRAVGVGVDLETAHIDKRTEQALSFPLIAQALAEEREFGARLLAIGRKHASGAARWLENHRDKRQADGWAGLEVHQRPSQTSIDHAAADATTALVVGINTFWPGRGECGVNLDCLKVRKWLGSLAWRAARKSLGDSGRVTTGRNDKWRGNVLSVTFASGGASWEA